LILMSIVSLSIFVLIVLGSSFLSDFLLISSSGLFILLGLVLLFAMVIPIPWGGLQGLQRFGLLSFNLIVNGGVKFFLGILLVLLGFGVLGAMGSIVISYAATNLISFVMIGVCLSRNKETDIPNHDVEERDPSFTKEVYQYFLPVGTTLLCFMVLTNADLILVKHFFPPLEAGYYSIAQMVGKIILFLPIPVVMVMFPKLTSLEGKEKKGLPILWKSLMVSLLLCGAAILVCLFFPSLILRILSGKIYLECIPLLRYFCINMAFYSLVFVLLYYHLSTRERSFLYPLVFLTACQIGLILLFHKTLAQVLVISGLISVCLLGTNFYWVFRSPRHGVQT
jgi:O-antigen/teichoic acid export membrane protein